MEERMDITGHIALITGGNKGIGYEIAKQLGALGAVVIVGGRNPERVEQAVSTLKDGGVDAHSVAIDVTDDDSIAAAAESIAYRFGRLDILMNNAGIAGGPGANVLPSDTTRAGLHEIFQTNVYGMVAVTNAFLELLRKSEHPRIVNTSSEVGSITSMTDSTHPFFGIGQLAYAASKSTVNLITAQYAKQLSSEGFRINASIPGWCATEFNNFQGPRSAAEGASVGVALATVPDDGPTGTFWGAMAGENDRNGFPGW
jgi:NAD(P)-dependent dehydrogenase (short-subunit alcohol dehydrogenase family)